jgi:hypothetical protein
VGESDHLLLESKSEIIIDLCESLLDDLELGTVAVDQIVLKASRLARLVGNTEAQAWLRFEMMGFPAGDAISLKYMRATGRFVNEANQRGYWYPILQISAMLDSSVHQLRASGRPPDFNLSISSANQYERPSETAAKALQDVMNQHVTRVAGHSQTISTFSSIKSKVVGLIHQFATNVYYERKFSAVAESIFEMYKRDLDIRLSAVASDVLAKFPAIYARLVDNDPEAISQALNSCRRVIDAFADALVPSSDLKVQLDQEEIAISNGRTKNKLFWFIAQRTASSSRKQRLKQTLINLYEQMSKGVHSNVDAPEARALILQTITYLGEVLELEVSALPPTAVSTQPDQPASVDYGE